MQLSVKYETVLNMTTAKALGIDVPTSILLSAAAGDKFKCGNRQGATTRAALTRSTGSAEFPRIRRWTTRRRRGTNRLSKSGTALRLALIGKAVFSSKSGTG